MLQNRKESIMAIVGILFIGLLSMNNLLDRQVGIVISLVIFGMSEVMTCYHMKVNKENWIKEAILGTVLTLVLVYLLFRV